jgi:hypothetical protein
MAVAPDIDYNQIPMPFRAYEEYRDQDINAFIGGNMGSLQPIIGKQSGHLCLIYNQHYCGIEDKSLQPACKQLRIHLRIVLGAQDDIIKAKTI